MGKKDLKKKSGQVRRADQKSITEIELQPRSHILNTEPQSSTIDPQLVDAAGNIIQKDIKLLDNTKENKRLCVYVPMTWPFTYTKFFENFLKIIHPKHMLMLREFGITDYYTHIEKKFPICRNRNDAVLKARKNGADYMLFLDGDMNHPQEIAYMLMRHQYPICGGVYHHQSPPHLPVLYFENLDNPKLYTHNWNYPRDRLFSVDMTGLGCLLVDLRVFDDMELPYFGYESTREDGLIDVSEDVLFCRQAKKVGHTIMIDPTVKCTHYALGEVSGMMFDVYMEKYRTYEEVIKKFDIDGTAKHIMD